MRWLLAAGAARQVARQEGGEATEGVRERDREGSARGPFDAAVPPVACCSRRSCHLRGRTGAVVQGAETLSAARGLQMLVSKKLGKQASRLIHEAGKASAELPALEKKARQAKLVMKVRASHICMYVCVYRARTGHARPRPETGPPRDCASQRPGGRS